jgi:hypothetical protein
LSVYISYYPVEAVVLQVSISTFDVVFLERGYARYAVREMNEQRILEELLALLESNGVTIRNEPLGGSGGGLCTIKGEQLFFVDTQATSTDSAAICAEAVSKLLDIEKLYIRPEIRQFIENHSNIEKEQ